MVMVNKNKNCIHAGLYSETYSDFLHGHSIFCIGTEHMLDKNVIH